MRFLPALLSVLALTACGTPAPEPQGNSAEAEAEEVVIVPAGKIDRSHAGAPAPDSAFTDPDGEPASIADFRGKPLLLNLWATWCAPCVEEMPTLDALAARSGDRLRIVALAQEDGPAKVEAFFAKAKLGHLEPFLDRELAMMTALKAESLPMTILYDGEGKEVWRMTGREDWTGERAAKLVAEAS
jgi:thiol-disulfide isomerase/thioredoxin